MVRIALNKNIDKNEAEWIGKRCEELHKEMLAESGQYTYDELCLAYAMAEGIGSPDAKAYLALAMAMVKEKTYVRRA